MSKEKKKEILVLNSAEPINDGGRKYNVIYYVSAIICAVIFLVIGANMLGIVFGLLLGLCVGWLIKNKLLETLSPLLRDKKFKVDNKIPYSELINRLIPRLTPLGAMIEKSSDIDGKPVITYQGAIYDVGYNDDDSFYIWWRLNVARAFLKIDSIGTYRKEVAAMGIIGYHVQQVCDHYDKSTNEQETTNQNNTKVFCKNCGNVLVPNAKFCGSCGMKNVE